MGKTLIIAEKPSVGRDIARVLGCSKKGDGFLYSDTHVVSWAIGHLVTLFDPDDYDMSLKKWSYNTLPIIPGAIKLKPVDKTKKQYDILRGLLNSGDTESIICATDAGREGELIFRYIYTLSGCLKPCERLWISSMTDTAVKEGFKNLKPLSDYDNLYLSAKCRSEADWLVGINATRAYTLTYDALLSVGRVQTPTLAIIVGRQKEIDVFVPEEYFIITGHFDDDAGKSYKGKWFVMDGKSFDTKVNTEAEANAILARVKGQGGTVTNIENEEKRQFSPFLYDLTELQRECNVRFSLSAQQTLSIAQDLYEKHKLITYPRTDSRFISSDMVQKLEPIMKRLAENERYKPYADYTLGLSPLPISKRIVDDSKITDHHAIIPTDAKRRAVNLSKNENDVYDLIVRRFFAVFYPPYIYNVTRITTDVNGDTFLTRGTTVISEGYMALYAHFSKTEKKDDDSEDDTLPSSIAKGDVIPLVRADKQKKKTKPPKPYTEATLLSAMENAGRFVDDEKLKETMKDAGLGTPATRAGIIERLIQVEYIKRKGKSLIPTEKGTALIAVVPHELKSPETTGKWEKGLNNIAKGTMDRSRFMESIARYVKYIVGECKKAENAEKTVTFPVDTRRERRKHAAHAANSLGKCPICRDGDVFENSKSFYCSKWRTGCSFTVWKDAMKQYGATVTPEIMNDVLAGKNPKIDITLPQTGEKCAAKLRINPETRAVIELIDVTRIEK